MADAREVAAAAAASGRQLVVDHVLRYNPLLQALVILQAELLGPVQRFAFENDASDEHLPPDHWFWDEATSGGIFLEHGVHFFDAAHLLLGTEPLAVSATAAHRADGTTDLVSATALHPGGALATHTHGVQPRRPVRAAGLAAGPRRRRGAGRGLDPAAGPGRGLDRRRRRRDGVRPARPRGRAVRGAGSPARAGRRHHGRRAPRRRSRRRPGVAAATSSCRTASCSSSCSATTAPSTRVYAESVRAAAADLLSAAAGGPPVRSGPAQALAATTVADAARRSAAEGRQIRPALRTSPTTDPT